jgi:hypothetical protein
MRRKITIALLALGTFFGFGSGIAQAIHHHHACQAAHRADTGNCNDGHRD